LPISTRQHAVVEHRRLTAIYWLGDQNLQYDRCTQSETLEPSYNSLWMHPIPIEEFRLRPARIEMECVHWGGAMAGTLDIETRQVQWSSTKASILKNAESIKQAPS
jgi:hypothetical protein